jgi:phospholipid/cholesterol/gamma-HCH transport system ATP-binding protein
MSFSPKSRYSSGLNQEKEVPQVIPAPRQALIIYRGVSKSFDGKPVLEGIDLEIYEGETLVVLGRSGSGKTVLTSMLVGLVQPDAGSILVAGKEITHMRSDEDWQELRLQTGYLFQGSALFDSMTVGENVAFPMVYHTNLKPGEISQRVHEKLDAVGLADVENLDPAALSGGMQRRAALARSLALDPQIIIYDEPTSGLDPITGDEIGQLIRELQEPLKVTSIVVTHDLRLTRQVADRLILLYEGHLVFLGNYEEFLKAPHPEIRRFLEAREDTPE